MFKPFLIIFSLLLVTMATFGQRNEAASHLSDLREIEQLEVEWNRINEDSDAERIGYLLADDSYHVGPSGRVYTRDQDVEAQRASRERKVSVGSTLKFVISNQSIRLFKNVAIVTATGRAVTTLADGTKRFGNSFRSVHVWEKRDGRWQLIVDQVTGIAR